DCSTRCASEWRVVCRVVARGLAAAGVVARSRSQLHRHDAVTCRRADVPTCGPPRARRHVATSARGHAAPPANGHHRRGFAVQNASRDRFHRIARRMGGRRSPRGEHDYTAAREESLPVSVTLDLPQAQGSCDRASARARPEQRPDHDALPRCGRVRTGHLGSERGEYSLLWCGAVTTHRRAGRRTRRDIAAAAHVESDLPPGARARTARSDSRALLWGQDASPSRGGGLDTADRPDRATDSSPDSGHAGDSRYDTGPPRLGWSRLSVTTTRYASACLIFAD